MRTTILAAVLFVAALPSYARADDGGIDVGSAEYLDVVQTADGSVWKGVVIEQTPNVSYKIATADGSVHVIEASDVVRVTKQRNKHHRSAPAPASGPGPGLAPAPGPAPALETADAMDDRGPDHSVGAWRSPSPTRWGLPPPLAMSGLRLEVASLIAFPTTDVGTVASTSFSPNIRVGYEAMFGNVGVEGGGMARFTDWRLQGDGDDSLWTMETMAYGRVALHISRIVVHAGIALGLDTNHIYSESLDMAQTSVGFGMNVQSGLTIAATPMLAFNVGFDYHPGTDTIADSSSASVSYVALLFGAGLRM